MSPSLDPWNRFPALKRVRTFAEFGRMGTKHFRNTHSELFNDFHGTLAETSYLYTSSHSVHVTVQGMRYQPDAIQALVERCVTAGTPMPSLNIVDNLLKSVEYAANLDAKQTAMFIEQTRTDAERKFNALLDGITDSQFRSDLKAFCLEVQVPDMLGFGHCPYLNGNGDTCVAFSAANPDCAGGGQTSGAKSLKRPGFCEACHDKIMTTEAFEEYPWDRPATATVRSAVGKVPAAELVATYRCADQFGVVCPYTFEAGTKLCKVKAHHNTYHAGKPWSSKIPSWSQKTAHAKMAGSIKLKKKSAAKKKKIA